MPYCTNCGASYPNGAAQCPNCCMLLHQQPYQNNTVPMNQPNVNNSSYYPNNSLQYQNNQIPMGQPPVNNANHYQNNMPPYQNYQAPPFQQTIIVNQQQNVAMGRPINKWVAFILCFFFGMMGVHKFYEGKVGMGLLYLFTGGLFSIGWFIDCIAILCKSNPYYK